MGENKNLLRGDKILELESFISRATQRFINCKHQNIQKSVYDTLQECGQIIGVDSVFIALYNNDQDSWTAKYEWQNNKEYRHTDGSLLFSKKMNWLHKQIADKNVILIEDCDQLPVEASREKKFFKSNQLKTILLLPLFLQSDCIGYFVLEAYSQHKTFSTDEKLILKALANTMALFLDRVRLETEGEYQLRFKQLMTDISARFVNVSGSRLHAAILESLKDIGIFFDADRAYLFNYSAHKDSYSLTHEWLRDGVSPTKHLLQDVTFEEYK